MPKRTTKSQTSNLVNKLGQSPSKPVASDQMKSAASGFQMKFNKINVSNFVTGSSSTSPGANYGNQSTINSIAGKKVGSATQIPKKSTQETIETKGEDSLISSLSKMFSFMQQTREDDIKRRDTERAFSEEKKTEEQKRHEQFLKVLKEYTSIGTTTLAPSSGDSGGGIMDFIKGMFDSFMEGPLKWLWDNKGIILNVLRLFGGPLAGMILAGSAIIWLAEQLKDYLRENVAHMDKLSPEKALELLQTPGAYREIEKYGGREELLRIAKEGHISAATILASGDIKKINDAGGKEFLEAVVKRGAVIVPDSVTAAKDLSQFAENGPKRPKGTGTAIPLKQTAWDEKWSKIYDPETGKRLDLVSGAGTPAPATMATPLPEGATPSTAGGGRGSINPVMPSESVPSATPVPPTPATSSVNDVIAKNADLVMNESTSSGSGTTQPIIASSTNSTSSPDRAMSSSATQRDDTAIINRVFDRVRGGV
jgi:hypothetical protein